MRSGGDALFEQVSDAVGEGAGLARAGPGNHESRAGQGGDGGVLLLIQFAGIIDLQLDGAVKRLKDIFARHPAEGNEEEGNGKIRSGRMSEGEDYDYDYEQD